jgi:hypothetical protein
MGDMKKGDSQKPMLYLLQPGWVWEVGEVLTHGAKKYEPNGWQRVEPERYISALLRHSLQVAAGETVDEETGLSHLAHIGCNAMFLWYFAEGSDQMPQRRCLCPVCTEER